MAMPTWGRDRSEEELFDEADNTDLHRKHEATVNLDVGTIRFETRIG